MQMEAIDFKKIQKKNVRLGVRISTAEKAIINEFCKKNGIK